MAISDWPANERPREKLLANGAQALSDAELLAIFLRVGMRGKSAVDLARDLLQRFGSLTALFAADLPRLAAVPGMGEAKYTQLQAVLEMARRALGETLTEQAAFTAPGTVRDFLRLHLGQERQEVFVALWLDNANKLIACDELARGTFNQAAVYPREVARSGLERHAAAVIFAHNHPAGTREPSAADRQLTQRLQDALALFDIRTLDHFIVAGSSPPTSFAERGWL
jgi:DNA repair protein RadC